MLQLGTEYKPSASLKRPGVFPFKEIFSPPWNTPCVPPQWGPLKIQTITLFLENIARGLQTSCATSMISVCGSFSFWHLPVTSASTAATRTERQAGYRPLKGPGPCWGRTAAQVQQVEKANPSTQYARLLTPAPPPSRLRRRFVNKHRKHLQLPSTGLQAAASRACWSGDLSQVVRLWFRLLLIRTAKCVLVVRN